MGGKASSMSPMHDALLAFAARARPAAWDSRQGRARARTCLGVRTSSKHCAYSSSRTAQMPVSCACRARGALSGSARGRRSFARTAMQGPPAGGGLSGRPSEHRRMHGSASLGQHARRVQAGTSRHASPCRRRTPAAPGRAAGTRAGRARLRLLQRMVQALLQRDDLQARRGRAGHALQVPRAALLPRPASRGVSECRCSKLLSGGPGGQSASPARCARTGTQQTAASGALLVRRAPLCPGQHGATAAACQPGTPDAGSAPGWQYRVQYIGRLRLHRNSCQLCPAQPLHRVAGALRHGRSSASTRRVAPVRRSPHSDGAVVPHQRRFCSGHGEPGARGRRGRAKSRSVRQSLELFLETQAGLAAPRMQPSSASLHRSPWSAQHGFRRSCTCAAAACMSTCSWWCSWLYSATLSSTQLSECLRRAGGLCAGTRSVAGPAARPQLAQLRHALA